MTISGLLCLFSEVALAICPLGSTSHIYKPEDLPQVIGPGKGWTESVIKVTDDFTLSDVNLLDLNGKHEELKELRFYLQHEADDVRLYGYRCGHNGSFAFGFDDQSELQSPCPPDGAGVYIPSKSLSAFNGSAARGDWVLKIYDRGKKNGGELGNWMVELCENPVDPLTQGKLTLTTTVENLDLGTAPSSGGPASKGDRLRYKIRFENTGNGRLSDIDIVDSIPVYSSLASLVTCPITLPEGIIRCGFPEPFASSNAIGFEGEVHWKFDGDLQPGETAEVEYLVVIE